ncbi:unnamed protein product [Amoebophrya sp. A25]|nr:unnamed protein product [Amoebophrya sp. A25]|eukprot:GSA25T00008660001.1
MLEKDLRHLDSVELVHFKRDLQAALRKLQEAARFIR